ncbi:MAG: T9SS type A sorting domain-containing protein [Flavobacteriales bacterium]|nr:T9SS type A sorting domain-containing protein [Flavobacteriales bacterium]
MRFHLLLRIASFMLLLVAATARAQVFIPDTLVRGWLNQSIPGIVDANGIMDTTHAGIAGCDSLNWYASNFTTDSTWIDLTGVQYLDYLEVLAVRHIDQIPGWTRINLPELPPVLSDLTIQFGMEHGVILLPDMDQPMARIAISSFPSVALDVTFGSITDTIGSITIWNLHSFASGSFSGYVEDLKLTEPEVNMDTLVISFPGWSCGTLAIEGFPSVIAADLANMSANRFEFLDGVKMVLSWPMAVTDIHLEGTFWGVIPAWPTTLTDLRWDVFNDVCIPLFPDALERIQIIGQNELCIPNRPAALQQLSWQHLWNYPGDTVYCSILNTDCPGTAAAIAGRHAVDDNGNGQLDAGEPAFPWGRVLIQPMNALVPAGADGWWERGAQPGTYTIEPNSTYPYLISSAPAQHTATFVALGEVDSTNHFAHTLLPGVNDLQVDAFAPPPRPGFDNTLHLSYRNYGTTALPATLQLSVDADQSFVSSSPAPTTLVGNSATWDLGTLPLGASGQVTITLHTDAAVPLGTPVLHTAVIDPVAGDTVPADNTTLWTDTVVGAYDPNDKLLDIAAATPAEVQADAITLTYTIRFQNTGTYPAERVLILDTLSDDLQWNSFELLASSHPCQWFMIDGVLHFLFDPILLPDSGSNEPASHGFVRFRMRPSTQLTHGEQVDNIAHIVFDFNTPIVTPPATFRVDVSTGVHQPKGAVFTVVPNPTRDRLLIAGLTGAATVRLLDLSGRLLRTQRVNAPALLDVGDLATGTYLLELRTAEAIGSVRFVKE